MESGICLQRRPGDLKTDEIKDHSGNEKFPLWSFLNFGNNPDRIFDDCIQGFGKIIFQFRYFLDFTFI